MPKEITPAVVQVEAGSLVGSDEDGILVFRGVPYAAPPVGNLRWRPPQPVAHWPGERAASAHDAPCPQPVDLDATVANFGGVSGAQSEDCLYLTIYAPPKTRKAPVLVWFHGGAFFLGAGHLGSYDGTANARDGVITVGVNYRLGALANFVHPALAAEFPEEAKGNYALQDSVAALEWVRENIAAFGGDPQNVIIAGQSAGGGIVTALLSLPAAKGLFGKAIVQSGSLLLPDRDPHDASKLAVGALTKIGVAPDIDASGLRAISAQTFAASPDLRTGFFFTSDAKYKPMSTIAALRAGKEVDVPLLVGSNAGERGFSAARTFARLAGDEGTPAFLYRFEHVPAFRTGEWTKGPIHSAELMFSFDSIDRSSWGGEHADATDRAIARTVNSCWIAFMKMSPGERSFKCGNGFEFRPYGEGGDAARFQTGGPVMAPADGLPDGPDAEN
ncbi:carboxylesterase/lipase family protein [Erythrobacter mangrovi]|uniref:Carboxylic ester hydrolase n=1 Tax=Erythrobacter mangrovi TaxID=2739433 RepID=A0A7D4BBR7_9SPHN|nr:carboxylesterase family protein [Erythrobacter mangrovi]QKG72201.1 carboxylesterase/lipase family protein [Erythrobacter mangrovi]